MTPTHGTLAGEAVLAVPHQLVLPEAARARLHRQFERVRPDVGVMAPIHVLEPGSSVTTAAERAALAPMDACTTTADVEVHGAVLLAAGVGHVVGERSIRIEARAPSDDAARAGLLVDPGAAAFDPTATDTTPAPPMDGARPPFRWRPLVLFLAGTPDPGSAQRAADLADALIDLDVEPRLAVHGPLDGPLRIAPVIADPAVIAALRPDLVIALDPDAIALAERAEGSARSMVVAVLVEDLGDRIELVPWTLGSAQGRLRARIGDRTDARAVAALVNRLCSGPVPGPPRDGPDRTAVAPSVPVPTPVPTPTTARGPSILRVPDDASVGPDAHPGPLLAGLTDHLLASGWVLEPPTGPAGGAAEPDLVLVGATGSDASPAIHVVEDLVAATRLAAVAATRGLDRRRVIAPSTDVAAPLRAAGIDTIVVPVLPTRSELVALTEAFERRVRPAVPAIALLVGDRAGPPSDPAVAEAVGRALSRVATTYGEMEVVVVGDADVEPALPRVDLADPHRLAGWSMAIHVDGSAGVTRSLTTLALAGVPVLMAAEDTRGLGALADRSIAVALPHSVDHWAGAIEELLDEGPRAVASKRSRRVGTSIAGTEAAALVLDRILGWWTEGPR